MRPDVSLTNRLTVAQGRANQAVADCEALALTCAQFEGQIQALTREIEEAETRVDKAALDSDELALALAILQRLEAAWKKTFEATLADVVSRGLSIVFGEVMRVEITSDVQRGASAVEFRLTTGSGNEALTTHIIGARGGSVVEVAAFLLHVLVILSSRPPLRRIILIDESFRMVADENLPALAEMIRRLAHRLAFQIVLTTHISVFVDAADVVYEVKAEPGAKVPTAQVRRIKSRQEVLT